MMITLILIHLRTLFHEPDGSWLIAGAYPERNFGGGISFGGCMEFGHIFSYSRIFLQSFMYFTVNNTLGS